MGRSPRALADSTRLYMVAARTVPRADMDTKTIPVPHDRATKVGLHRVRRPRVGRTVGERFRFGTGTP